MTRIDEIIKNLAEPANAGPARHAALAELNNPDLDPRIREQLQTALDTAVPGAWLGSTAAAVPPGLVEVMLKE